MAEVTINTGTFIVNDEGGLAHVYAEVNVANTGDTFTPGLRDIRHYSAPPTTNLTTMTKQNNASGIPQIVFTTGGAVSNLPVHLVGYK